MKLLLGKYIKHTSYLRGIIPFGSFSIALNVKGIACIYVMV